MKYEEVLEMARGKIGPKCKACPVCNGLGCGNTLPGPGSKKPGNVANDNYNAWRKIKLNMDTIVPNTEIDTSIELFGKKLSMPLVTGPIGSIGRQFHLTVQERFGILDAAWPSTKCSSTGHACDPPDALSQWGIDSRH